MNARWTILCIGLAASLALWGNAAAQTRLALTSPNVGPDPLDSPVPSAPRPPAANTMPPGAGPRVDPGFGGIQTRPLAAAPEPRGNPLWAIPLTSLTLTRDRPLFTPTRRPPAAPVAYVEPPRPVAMPTPAAPELPRLTLIGVVLGEKDGIGIFLDGATREVIRLRKNEGHSGWILRSLQGREATLEKDTSTAVLVIPPPGGEQSPGVLISKEPQL
jgi:general secretion pathway protein N